MRKLLDRMAEGYNVFEWKITDASFNDNASRRSTTKKALLVPVDDSLPFELE